MKRIVVTGGAGFLGSHLCERLLGEGNEVTAVDNLFTGREANISHLMTNPKFKFVRHDIVDPIDIAADEIYNLACPASPPHYQYDPIKTTKTCVIGVINMLDLAAQNGARILQASTSEVYGDPPAGEHPQKESYRGNVNTIGIRACYDEGKRVGETLFFDYHRERGVDIKVMRIFNTYGTRMDPADGRVVSNFIVQALRGEDITVYGDGTQTRSFCYVSDMIDGMVRLMNSREGFTGPVNIGNPGEFTIAELARKVIAVTGSRSKLIHLPLPQDDPLQRRPDITLAGAELGWSPRVQLDEGLALTVPYFARQIELGATA